MTTRYALRDDQWARMEHLLPGRVGHVGGTARDIVRLARCIKSAVADRFKIALRPEPVFVGFDADPDIEPELFRITRHFTPAQASIR